MKIIYKILKNNHLKNFSKIHSIPYYLMNNGSDKSLESWVKAEKPDLIIIYSMPLLLKENIFNIPTYKTVNLHPSLLPKYRGANPFFWHYFNHETKGGVTLHFIDSGEDTGDIIYQEEYDIQKGMTLKEMKQLAIEKIGVNLLFKCIKNIKNLPSNPQVTNHLYSKARYLTQEDYKMLIDWEKMKIEKIWHIFRGFPNWMETLNSTKLKDKIYLWEIKDYNKENMKNYKKGEIYKEKNSYFISCQEGKIYLDKKGFNFNYFIVKTAKLLRRGYK